MIQNCQYYWAPSVSENLSYFIAGFLWATIVNPSKWGERIAKRLKDQVWENFYKMNCSRAQFPAGWVKLCFETNKQMQNILLFSCLTHTKAYTFILWTSLVCWPDRLCSTWLLCLNVHARFCEKLGLIGEHCQFVVNETADFKHCYLCNDCIVIFLNFEHGYNQSRRWIQVE